MPLRVASVCVVQSLPFDHAHFSNKLCGSALCRNRLGVRFPNNFSGPFLGISGITDVAAVRRALHVIITGSGGGRNKTTNKQRNQQHVSGHIAGSTCRYGDESASSWGIYVGIGAYCRYQGVLQVSGSAWKIWGYYAGIETYYGYRGVLQLSGGICKHSGRIACIGTYCKCRGVLHVSGNICKHFTVVQVSGRVAGIGKYLVLLSHTQHPLTHNQNPLSHTQHPLSHT
jgi:hypothetical protein